MRVQMGALSTLLQQMLTRLGLRMDQSGAGTQIGQVQGNVYVYNAPPEPEPEFDAQKQPAPAQPKVSDVMALLDALDAYEGKRSKVLKWAGANIGTKLVKQMNEQGLRRIYGYALTTLDNCRNEEKRLQRLSDDYRKRRNKK